MTARPILPNLRLAACLLVAALVVFPGRGTAQGHGGGSRQNASSGSGYADSGGPKTPEPYDAQIYCPVTGKKLGLTQPAIPVETNIGAKGPGFWGKIFGQKPTPGVVIYVCCPECADAVKSDPMKYLGEVVADKSCFNFTYAKAPAQRPARVNTESAPADTVAPDQAVFPKPPPPPAPSPLARPVPVPQPGNPANP